VTLTLTIRNVDALENGAPTEFVLHRRGATIGRAPTCDWSLPDPHRYISSCHCEVAFENESYVLSDVSTNGTFLNGGGERMDRKHVIAAGDVVQIGHYQVVAALSGSALAALEPDSADAAEENGWAGWEGRGAVGAPTPPQRPSPESWDDDPSVQSSSPISAPEAWDTPAGTAPVPGSPRWGIPPPPPVAPAPGGWDPSHRAEIAAASIWDAPERQPDPASAWSSAAPDRPPPPTADDVWGRIADGNVVDWARGGFGQPVAPPGDPLGLARGSRSAHLPEEAPAADSPPPAQTPPTPAVASRQPPRATARDAAPALREFLAAAGLGPGDVKGAGPQTLARAGVLLRRLVAGLVILVEARARAKSQMGAESTRLEFDGNNPIKFARGPEQALAQLLGPPERGFMGAERAIEDAYFDLQSHQMATLKAMQGALKATLERFAPDAIRRRTEHRGLLARMLRVARDAALWQSYEREFGGVARGSDEAFMDVFAKEFRKAYEEQARQRK
jgi:type VI secretion system FHA domain protein